MKSVKLAACALICAMSWVGTVNAAPLLLTLVRTSVLYNEDPPGAPLPLARTQYDAGDVLLGHQKVAEYLRVKDVHAGGLNAAAMTITLFFPNGQGGAPHVIALQGSHYFTSGNEIGSISASSIPGLQAVLFTYGGGVLTLLLP